MSGVLLDFNLDVIRKKVADDSTLSLNQVCDFWRNEKYVQSELGLISSQDFFEFYSKEIELHWSYERWINEWANICSLNKNGSKLFHCLRRGGYKVCILSNLAEYHKNAVQQKFPEF
jgi:hypothetical protein